MPNVLKKTKENLILLKKLYEIKPFSMVNLTLIYSSIVLETINNFFIQSKDTYGLFEDHIGTFSPVIIVSTYA